MELVIFDNILLNSSNEIYLLILECSLLIRFYVILINDFLCAQWLFLDIFQKMDWYQMLNLNWHFLKPIYDPENWFASIQLTTQVFFQPFINGTFPLDTWFVIRCVEPGLGHYFFFSVLGIPPSLIVGLAVKKKVAKIPNYVIFHYENCCWKPWTSTSVDNMFHSHSCGPYKNIFHVTSLLFS